MDPASTLHIVYIKVRAVTNHADKSGLTLVCWSLEVDIPVCTSAFKTRSICVTRYLLCELLLLSDLSPVNNPNHHSSGRGQGFITAPRGRPRPLTSLDAIHFLFFMRNGSILLCWSLLSHYISCYLLSFHLDLVFFSCIFLYHVVFQLRYAVFCLVIKY